MTVIDKQCLNKINRIRESAKSRNIDCTLSERYVQNILNQSICAYTNEPFLKNNKKKFMSMERLNNDIGYEEGNVIPVIVSSNTAKSNFSLEELQDRVISQYIINHNRENHLKGVLSKIDEETIKYNKYKERARRFIENYSIALESDNITAEVNKNCATKLPVINSNIRKSKNTIEKLQTDKERLNRYIIETNNTIDEYLVIIEAIHKYTNLSFIQRQKLKYGLSINATLTDLLVEVIEFNK